MADGIPESVNTLGLPEEVLDYDPYYDREEEVDYTRCIHAFSNSATGMHNYLADLLLHEAYRRYRSMRPRKFVPAPPDVCWPAWPEDLEDSLLVVRRPLPPPPVRRSRRSNKWPEETVPLYLTYLRLQPRNSSTKALHRMMNEQEKRPAPQELDMFSPNVADLEKEFVAAPPRDVPFDESHELYLALEDCVGKVWEQVLKEYLLAHPLEGTAEQQEEDTPVLDRYLTRVVAVRCQKLLSELLEAMIDLRRRIDTTTYGPSRASATPQRDAPVHAAVLHNHPPL